MRTSQIRTEEGNRQINLLIEGEQNLVINLFGSCYLEVFGQWMRLIGSVAATEQGSILNTTKGTEEFELVRDVLKKKKGTS